MRSNVTAVVLFALLALAPAGAVAQAPSTPACPVVNVSCPDEPSGGKAVKFTANVSSGDTSVTPTFKWSVSGGKIVGGQGTYEIEVEVGSQNPLLASVEVGGYAPSCRAEASCAMWACNFVGLTRKVAEYGNVKPSGETRVLTGFAQELRNDPTARGYVMTYAGRRARRGEARERGARVVRYLVGALKLYAGRLVVIDGGHREEPAVELYLVGSGGIPPQAAPTVEPAEVKFAHDARAGRAGRRQMRGRGRR